LIEALRRLIVSNLRLLIEAYLRLLIDSYRLLLLLKPLVLEVGRHHVSLSKATLVMIESGWCLLNGRETALHGVLVEYLNLLPQDCSLNLTLSISVKRLHYLIELLG
jgi:hypothetical protein